MATAIIMPKAGMAMETGTIIEWKVAVGDRIEVGDEILEIETDKVAMPVEAETSGVLLAITRQPGDVVPVTETIGWIGESGEAIPEDEPAGTTAGSTPGTGSPSGGDGAAAKTGAAGPAGAAAAGNGATEAAGVGRPAAGGPAADGRVPATPAAKRLAAERGVDLRSVTASAPDGAVRTRDLPAGGSAPGVTPLAREEARRAGISLEGIHGSGPGGRIRRQDVVEQAALEPSVTAVTTAPADTRTPLVGMRRVIAERMLESHRTMPPATLNTVVRVNALLELRRQLNDGAEGAGRRPFSINDLLLLATAKAVRACPWVRVSMDGDDVVQHEAVDIGMAVALDQGLIVPVIHGADALTLTAISERARDLGRRARERKLEVAELQGGTFTVSNLGMYGITTFTPIINPPQAAILGVGTIRKELELAEGGAVVERSVMDLSLTVDHRLIDGAQGALFLQALTGLLEHPAQILV
jgi:pyruvate dehydrogenase E2 component (dihydrolipoamide acetyltransferase)